VEPDTERVFKALADPSRRLLLDRLFDHDGQTLGQLCSALPEMTRFGVMKHLDVLEAAGLVSARRAGREKLHYLNPVPIRLVHDRWISKYAEPFVRALSQLKADLESAPGSDAGSRPTRGDDHPMSTTETTTETTTRPAFVHEIYIRTTAERLWQALTDPLMTERYYYGGRVRCDDWRAGEPYSYLGAGDVELIRGEIVEAEAPHRLVMTFSALWDQELMADRPSRLNFQITPLGETCKLTVVHDGFDAESPTLRTVRGGWPWILSGLKSLLETGEPLPAASA
jgi:uncharacterized protein YndB with AHSA1/START domain/DNA-binding transcriptional ArsR family regulator